MLNIDKVKGILRAKQGSQVPKFLKPSMPIKLNNSFMEGSILPISLSEQASNDLKESMQNFTIPDPFAKQKALEREAIKKSSNPRKAALGLARGTHMVSNGEVVYDFKNQILKPVGNAIGEAANFIGDFAKNNPNIVGMGLDFIGNLFEKGVTNNKGSQAIFEMADLATNGLFMADPVLGLGAKAAVTLTKGVNKWFGKQSDSYRVNKELEAKMGGSYTGSYKYMHDAENKLNKFYGFWSTGSRQNANRHGLIARGIEANIEDIADTANDLRAMVNDINYKRYEIQTNGGYNLALNVKQGGTLTQKINLIKSRKFNQVINVDTKQVEEFKEGGKLETSEWKPIIEDLWEPVINIFQKGGKTRTLEELIEYAKKENPRFIQRLSEDPRGINFVDEEGKNAQGSHLLGYELDEEGNAIVFPSIQEMEDGNLKYLSLWDAFDRAIEKKNFLKMTPEEAKLFTESGEDELGNLFGYKKGWPEFFKKFKKGGTLREDLETPEIEETTLKNLIPEGALHKNKHHMEHTEGLTLKGIPVIDNEGEQLAEIELDEIIFTLEVTKKLEELYKEGTDEAAIEAGKLLVKEILFNTDDRTGLINKCENGGKLNNKNDKLCNL